MSLSTTATSSVPWSTASPSSLTIRGDRVVDGNGQALAGDRVENFHRLFGDGDRDVDSRDMFHFRDALFGFVPYVGYFDYDGSGNVDRTIDLVEIRKRLLTTI